MQTSSLLELLGPLLVTWLGLVGLVIGSFLNVVIARVPSGLSIVRPGSCCPKCGHALAWFENVPVLSYLALRGRCRSCRAPISIRYPLIETLSALLFLACLRRFGWEYELAPALMLVTLLIPLTFIDAEHWILPHAITVPGIFLGVAMAVPLGAGAVLSMALGAALGFLAFRAMEFLGWLAFRKEALGAGDKFLMALIGAFLGYKALFALIFLSSLQGSLFGGARLLLTGRAGPEAAPPDAPACTPTAAEAAPSTTEAQAPPPGAQSVGAGAEPGQPGDGAASAPAPPEATLPPPPGSLEPTMTWEFLKPGLPIYRRLLLLPYSVFLQPIPDDPVDDAGEEVEWTPGPSNLPFGPWLALAALELLLLGDWLADSLPLKALSWMLPGRG